MFAYTKLFLVCLVVVPGASEHNHDIGLWEIFPFEDVPCLRELCRELEGDFDFGRENPSKWLDSISMLRQGWHCHRNYPHSWESFRFPSYGICKSHHDFSCEVIDNIEKEIDREKSWNPDKPSEILKELFVARDKVMWRKYIWFDLMQLADPDSGTATRRYYLDMLRFRLGEEAYYNGPIPTCVPLELFREQPDWVKR